MTRPDLPQLNSRVALQSLSEHFRCGMDFGILLFRQNKLLTCYLGERRDLLRKNGRYSSIPGWDEDLKENLQSCQWKGKDFYATLTDWGVAIHGTMGGTLPDFFLSVLLYTSDRGVARVLRYAFEERVECSPEVLALATENMRREDEGCYAMIGRILTGWKSMLYGCGAPVRVEDGESLRKHLLCRTESICTFVGHQDLALDKLIPMMPPLLPYSGYLYPERLTVTLLLLFLGARRGFPLEQLRLMEYRYDREKIYPMVSVPSGNRRKIPPEWEMLRELGKAWGCFVDIRRKEGEIFLRFCPLVQDNSAAAVSVRSRLPIIRRQGLPEQSPRGEE